MSQNQLEVTSGYRNLNNVALQYQALSNNLEALPDINIFPSVFCFL